MKKILSLVAAMIILTPPVYAQSFDWGGVKTPVRPADWNIMPDDGRTGYAIGALQMAGYLAGDDENEKKCVVALYEDFVDANDEQEDDDPLIFKIDDMAKACPNPNAEPADFLSSTTISKVFNEGGQSSTWIGFILGMSDFLHFRVFGSYGDEIADCVQDKTLDFLRVDTSDPSNWTQTPGDPFVEDAMFSALSACGVK